MWPSVIESLINQKNPYDISAKSDTKNKIARFWFPTLVLNLDIKKALPQEGVEWLFARVYSKQIKNGRFDLEVVIMDAEGDIVALSHHSCLAVSAARNITRNKSKI